MTDQKYKLVPVEPTVAMLQVGKHSAPYRAIDVWRGMLKVAPEPVCGWSWSSIDGSWACDCGGFWVFIDGSPADNDCHFCPHCGKKVEVAEDD